MTLKGIFELRNQPVILYATTAAVIVASNDIINEDPGTPNHANRKLWANRNPEDNARQITPVVAMNTDVQNDWEAGAAQNPPLPDWERISDNDIQFIVNGNINRFATG